jgi:hypothetical protein
MVVSMNTVRHLLNAWLFGGGVYLETPDGGGAGGGQPAAGAAPAETPATSSFYEDLGITPDPDPAERAQAEPDDEDLDEKILADEDPDSVAPAGETADQRVNRLAKRQNKIKRRLAKALPIVKRLKGVNLDDLFYKAKQFDDLDAQFRKNPRLKAVMTGESAEDPGTTRDERTSAPAPFDESALPFDPNANPVHRWMADLAKDHHGLKHENAQLRAQLENEGKTRQQQQTAQTERAERAQWGAIVKKALPHVPKNMHGLFNDAMIAAYERRGQHKMTPQQIVKHYVIDQLGLKPAQSKAVRDAVAKTRTVEANKGWPRSQAGGGSPAPAQRGKVSMADIRKRLQKGAPVGG